MVQRGRRRLTGIAVCLLLFVVVGLSPTPTQSQPPSDAIVVNLPLVQTFRPPPAPTLFGAELLGNSAPVVALAEEGGLTWARLNRLSWSSVEPTPGARDWAAVANVEAALIARSKAGLTNLLIVGDTPAWARRDPSRICSTITPEALDDFARFMADLATRYNRPPYYVSHFELYNEPDVASGLVPTNSPFGCWGDEGDSFYGGAYYSQMLSIVYPQVKANHPDVQIVVGGLLLNCDYTYDYPDNRDCDSAKFLRGILRAGNGENFDILAYHGYPLHGRNRNDWERNYYLWAHRGGAVFGKLAFLREELADFGLDKPILLTEGALICYEGASCNDDQTLLRQDQANYIVRLYSRAIANDLDGVMWYSFNDPGWRYAGLLDTQENPLPAYHALKFMTTHLSRATFTARLGDGDGGLEGYGFSTPQGSYRVYWSNTERAYSFPYPAGATLYDKLGNLQVPPTNGRVVVGFEPLYLRLAD